MEACIVDIFLNMAQQPLVGQCLLLLSLRYHTQTHRNRPNSSGWWSVRCKVPFLAKHNTYKRQTSFLPTGFEPAIPTSEQPQTHALDRAAAEFGFSSHTRSLIAAVKFPIIEHLREFSPSRSRFSLLTAEGHRSFYLLCRTIHFLSKYSALSVNRTHSFLGWNSFSVYLFHSWPSVYDMGDVQSRMCSVPRLIKRLLWYVTTDKWRSSLLF
jgi:hypothetical protein